jgi:outer membrane protein OmpA-like peptidoglycan-associated protein
VLVLAGAAALLAGHFGLPTLPFDLEGEQAAKPATATPPKPATDRAGAEAPTAGSVPAPEQSAAAASEATLDIARISPDGPSVMAGRAEPHAVVTVLEDGKAVGSATADENGEWSVVTEHKFSSPDPKLSFRAEPPAAERQLADAEVKVPETAAPGSKTADERAQAGALSPKAVTAELMKKFEGLVAEAREEAKKEKEAPSQPSAKLGVGAAAPQAADAPSANPSPPRVVPAPKESAAAPSPRAAPPETIPVPIMFVYNEATFTDEGRRAASLLLEYLKLKHFDLVALSGHADERGEGTYNMELSRERLDAVSRLLRDGGFAGSLDLMPKGETEPFTGVDRAKYAGDALYQLDRRVELRLVR